MEASVVWAVFRDGQHAAGMGNGGVLIGLKKGRVPTGPIGSGGSLARQASHQTVVRHKWWSQHDPLAPETLPKIARHSHGPATIQALSQGNHPATNAAGGGWAMLRLPEVGAVSFQVQGVQAGVK